MRSLVAVCTLGWLLLNNEAQADSPVLAYPLIQGFGGVAPLPQAAEQPRKGAKIVFDITVESKPDEVNRGLESVARYLNLNAQAGNASSEVKLALVMHGGSTRCSLTDEAYARETTVTRNPNLALLRELKKHDVEVYVCGQSLARSKFALTDVASEATVAVSAMTVNVNKQQDGFMYLGVH
jgi:intracellular sulfur oxidation DsrE/DsrF family protein